MAALRGTGQGLLRGIRAVLSNDQVWSSGSVERSRRVYAGFVRFVEEGGGSGGPMLVRKLAAFMAGAQ